MKRKSKRIVRLMALRVLFVVVTLFLSTGSLMAQTTETVGNNSEPKQLLTPQGNDFYRHEVRLSGRAYSIWGSAILGADKKRIS